MAPKIGQKYFGYIVIALAAYGDNVIFDCDFAKNDDPWLFEDVCEFAFAKTDGAERPGLYRFDGWYKKFKNGNYRFGGGKFRKVY